MRKDSLWLSTVQISLSKLFLFFFPCLNVRDTFFFSGCKSWKKSRKPIAGVKSNCVCYWGHSVGALSVCIVCNV